MDSLQERSVKGVFGNIRQRGGQGDLTEGTVCESAGADGGDAFLQDDGPKGFISLVGTGSHALLLGGDDQRVRGCGNSRQHKENCRQQHAEHGLFPLEHPYPPSVCGLPGTTFILEPQ